VRAGELGLRLLSAPANVRVLEKLEAGATVPKAGGDLAELDLVEVSDGSSALALTRSGIGLLSVAKILANWLSLSPRGERGLGQAAAQRAVRALLGGWGPGIMRALAARSFSNVELQRLLPSLGQASLEARVQAMLRAGLVEVEAGEDGADRLAVTDWLRYAVGPLAASARWERQHLPAETTPVTAVDVESVFLLIVPLMRPARPVSGTCRMAVELPSAAAESEIAGMVVDVRDGVVDSYTSRLSEDVSARVEGSSRAWLRAAIDGKDDRLQLSGDLDLARTLLRHSLDLPWR
jgi:DNA-binding HxlR family transcriptional regulator